MTRAAPRSGSDPRGLPPGWPGQVAPADTPGWVQSARAWLLDLSPPDYRGYPVLNRHPLALAFITHAHVEAGLAAVRQARGQARSAFSDLLSPSELAALLEVLDHEELRLLAAGRGVALVTDALRGRRRTARL